MTAQTTPEAAYAAACLPDRLRSAACLDRVHFDVPGDEEELVEVLHEAADKLEASAALQSLSAAYRVAYAAHREALAAIDAVFRGKYEQETFSRVLRTAEDAMEAAKQVLLSAALDIK